MNMFLISKGYIDMQVNDVTKIRTSRSDRRDFLINTAEQAFLLMSLVCDIMNHKRSKEGDESA